MLHVILTVCVTGDRYVKVGLLVNVCQPVISFPFVQLTFIDKTCQWLDPNMNTTVDSGEAHFDWNSHHDNQFNT